jgi:glycosyltransferase involved in cell wall biosynthesis
MTSDKPKIGIVARYFPPSIGGVQTHIKQTADILSDRGYDIKFFTCEQGEAEIDSEYTVIRHQSYNRIINIPLLTNTLYNFVSDCDIIHVHSVSGLLSTLTEIIANVSGTPVVLTAHGTGIVDHPEYRITGRLSHNTTRRMSLKLADGLISTCPHFTDIALRYIDQETVWEIPNGVDTEFFTPGEAEGVFSAIGSVGPDSNVILSVNMIKPVKGMQYVIQALPYILDSHANTHYIIVGDGNYKSKLKELADNRGVRNNIHFPGATMDSERVRMYFRAADVAVVPSSGESTSISALEALGTECPLIASPVGGLKDLIGENERGRIAEIFPPGSYKRSAPTTLTEEKIAVLAEELSWVLSNPEEAEQLGKEGREHVIENYSWPVIVDQIEELYQEFL